MHTIKKTVRSLRHITKLLAAVVLLALIVFLCARQISHVNPPSESPTYLYAPFPTVYDTPPVMPEVQRAPTGSDDVRVELVTAGTRVDNISCAQWTSAVLSGVHFTTAGFGRDRYSHLDKLSLINRVATLRKLRDWDVIVALDQDIVFTGTSFEPFIDDFIRHSPAHPDDLNVRDIRRGVMVSPLRFSPGTGCWAPSSTESIEKCEQQFRLLEAAVSAGAAEHDFEYLWGANVSFMNGRVPELYLNAGFSIARVWAFRELLVAQDRFIPVLPYRGAKHWCDQSIFTALYLDMRWSELNLGLLTPNAHLLDVPRVNQFGLHYGLIDLWRVKTPVAIILGHNIPAVRIDASLYDLPYSTSMFTKVVKGETAARTVRGILHEIPAPASYIRDVPLPYHNLKGIHSVRTAPSLFSVSPRLIDRTADGDFPPLYPVALHFAGLNKDAHFAGYLPFFGWYIAMDLEPGQRARTVDALLSTVVPVVGTDHDTGGTINMGAHCGRWISDNLVNGPKAY